MKPASEDKNKAKKIEDTNKEKTAEDNEVKKTSRCAKEQDDGATKPPAAPIPEAAAADTWPARTWPESYAADGYHGWHPSAWDSSPWGWGHREGEQAQWVSEWHGGWRRRRSSWDSLTEESQPTPTPVKALRRSDTTETEQSSGVAQALQRLRSFDQNGDLSQLAQSLEAKFMEMATPTKATVPSLSTATPGSIPSPGTSERSPTEVLNEAAGLNGQGQNSAEAGTSVPAPEPKSVVTPEPEPTKVETSATEDQKKSEGPEPKTVETPEPKPPTVETSATEDAQKSEAPTQAAQLVVVNNKATEDPKEKATEASEKKEENKSEATQAEVPKKDAKTGEDFTEKEAKKAEELKKRKMAAHARYMRYYRSVRGMGLIVDFTLFLNISLVENPARH